jgi:hypothetical protein
MLLFLTENLLMISMHQFNRRNGESSCKGWRGCSNSGLYITVCICLSGFACHQASFMLSLPEA